MDHIIMFNSIAFIFNPTACGGTAKSLFDTNILPHIKKYFNDNIYTVQATLKKGDAFHIARKLAQQKYDVLVACGGDGTINEVVNGILASDQVFKPTIGFLPLGTGNDFVRSIGLYHSPIDYEKLVKIIKNFNTISIDVGHIKNNEKEKYWINSCGVGISGDIVETVNNSGSSWLPQSILFKAHTLYHNLFYTNKTVKYIIDDTTENIVKNQAIIVSNGKYFGGGMMGSPSACINDGILNYGVLGDIGIIDMINILPTIYTGEHVNHAKITTNVCQKIECIPMNDKDSIKVETDGEFFGLAPCTITIKKSIIKIIVP